MKYIIYTDGGSRGNPGQAASAFILKNTDNQKLIERGFYLGLATNNEAEYKAVEKALEFLINTDKNAKLLEIEIRADSKLIVEQLKGNWKIKNENLKDYFWQIKQLENEFAKVNYVYIERTKNKEADLLVNLTLDSQFRGL